MITAHCELLPESYLLLLVPGPTAALGLVIIMIGAVVLHATKIPGGLANGVPALVFLALLVLWLRRPAPAVA